MGKRQIGLSTLNNKQEIIGLAANPEEIYTFAVQHGKFQYILFFIWKSTVSAQSNPADA